MKQYARFDRFDICEAWYLYSMLYHDGMFSKEYKISGRLINMGFKPSPLLCDRDSLTDNGKVIFDNLVDGYSKVN